MGFTGFTTKKNLPTGDGREERQAEVIVGELINFLALYVHKSGGKLELTHEECEALVGSRYTLEFNIDEDANAFSVSIVIDNGEANGN